MNFFQYEKEQQQQNMTDLKLKNDSDRLQLGIRLLSFADCSLFIYCINHCLIDHCLALTAPLNAHTHFISYCLTHSPSHCLIYLYTQSSLFQYLSDCLILNTSFYLFA